MPCPSPAYHPQFSAADVAALQHLVRRPTTEQRYVQRAQLALLLAAEPTVSNTAAGERLGKPPNWVFTWRKRWAQAGFAVTALGPKDYVLSADEKTSIQARARIHVRTPPRPGRQARYEFEYQRRGAVQYLAAWDVHRGRIFGRCEARTGIEPFGRLVAQVMKQAPYRTARRVYWIVDSGSSHRGATAVRRLEQQYPNLRLIHVPIHASWLNQIEIYFSIIQRKVLTPNDFPNTKAVAARLRAFEARWNAAPKPFAGRFTRDDLERQLRAADDRRQLPAAA